MNLDFDSDIHFNLELDFDLDFDLHPNLTLASPLSLNFDL